MKTVELNYVALTDEDDHHLHTEFLALSDDQHASVEPFLKILNEADHRDPAASHGLDRQTEGMIKNLLRSGAKRVDGPNGEAAITVRNFKDEATMTMFREGGELDEADAPLPVLEKHYQDGKPHYTVGYDRSGVPSHVKFKDDIHSQFMSNMTPEAALESLQEIVAKRTAAPVIRMNNAPALTAAV